VRLDALVSLGCDVAQGYFLAVGTGARNGSVLTG
jgi:EAL domain-containing protein (putative c-di-GMP-specific phosphodiesterase class I)